MTAMPTCDVIDAVPDAPSCDTQFRQFGRKRVTAGPIRTLKVFQDNGLVKNTLATPGNGAILVVDGGASLYSAPCGDMIATSAMENGWAGIIINGAVRDSALIATMDISVKALGTNPRKRAKDAKGEQDTVISFGGVDFIPGHYLYSDDDGIVVLPQAL